MRDVVDKSIDNYLNVDRMQATKFPSFRKRGETGMVERAARSWKAFSSLIETDLPSAVSSHRNPFAGTGGLVIRFRSV